MIPRYIPYIDYEYIFKLLKENSESDDNYVIEFKNQLKEYFKAADIKFFISGRGALFNILKDINLPGNEVILQNFSCPVIVEAIVKAGKKPVIVDTTENFNIDIKSVEKNISKNTLAVIGTHPLGYIDNNIYNIRKLCDESGIILIEDCAQILTPDTAGSLGDFSIYSFGYDKPLALGIGGAVRYNNEKYCSGGEERSILNVDIEKRTLLTFITYYIICKRFPEANSDFWAIFSKFESFLNVFMHCENLEEYEKEITEKWYDLINNNDNYDIDLYLNMSIGALLSKTGINHLKMMDKVNHKLNDNYIMINNSIANQQFKLIKRNLSPVIKNTILCRNRFHRKVIIERLKANGIEAGVFNWPHSLNTLLNTIDKTGDITISDRIVNFANHSYLKKNELKKIINTLNDITLSNEDMDLLDMDNKLDIEIDKTGLYIYDQVKINEIYSKIANEKKLILYGDILTVKKLLELVPAIKKKYKFVTNRDIKIKYIDSDNLDLRPVSEISAGDTVVILSFTHREEIVNALHNKFKDNISIINIFNCDDKYQFYIDLNKLNQEKHVFLLEKYLYIRSGFLKHLLQIYGFKKPVFSSGSEDKIKEILETQYILNRSFGSFKSSNENTKRIKDFYISHISNKDDGENNVCMICLDGVRPDHLSIYGYNRVTDYILRKIEPESIIFENAFATGNWTLPSLGSIFSKEYPFKHGTNVEYTTLLTDEKNKLVKELVKRHFYLIASSANPNCIEKNGFLNGFNYVDYSNISGKQIYNVLKHNEDSKHKFYFLNFMEIHRQRYGFNYKFTDFKNNPDEIHSILDNTGKLDNRLLSEKINYYDDKLKYMMKQIEFYIDYFPDNTLFIFFSDHGDYLGENNLLWHYNDVNNVLLKTVMIIYKKGLKGYREKRLFSLIDLQDIILHYIDNKDIKYKKREYVHSQRTAIPDDRIKRYKFYSHNIRKYTQHLHIMQNENYKYIIGSDGLEEFYVLPDDYKNRIDKFKDTAILNEFKEKLETDFNDLFKNINFELYDKKLPDDAEVKKQLQSLGYL